MVIYLTQWILFTDNIIITILVQLAIIERTPPDRNYNSRTPIDVVLYSFSSNFFNLPIIQYNNFVLSRQKRIISVNLKCSGDAFKKKNNVNYSV